MERILSRFLVWLPVGFLVGTLIGSSGYLLLRKWLIDIRVLDFGSMSEIIVVET